MPSTLLFAINSEGRVFGLSTNGTKWREFIYLGLEFKQLSAVPNFLWALGGDRQIYVHAYGLDIPIRVKEESYENERWTPFDGFSKRLLPTDRYSYSNMDGTLDRNLKNIRLPSMAWQWEGDWKLELTLDGQPLDHDGWTYAVDFPGTYHPKKQWTSCVRRRKWIRYRKYIALNSWCAIAPLHRDPTKEPFIGIAVGGNQLPGGKAGIMLVWAVTAYGRVMFRTDVSNISPEGQRWSSVPIMPGCEVSQISVGATGLVWAVLWNGKALVRTGITRDCFTGNGWSEVEQPAKNLTLNQVSIGYNGLWAITQDFRVWFRKGIQGECSGISENLAKGTGWIEMCGSMSNISVASNDQVWAVGAGDKILYFRTSVTSEDLMGKTWHALGAPTQLSRASSSNSLTSGKYGSSQKRHRSWTCLNKAIGFQDDQGVGCEFSLNETCHSAPVRNVWQKSPSSSSTEFYASSRGSNSCVNSYSNAQTSLESLEKGALPDENLEKEVGKFKEFVESGSGEWENNSNRTYENVYRPVCGFISKEVAMPTRSWSPQHAGGTVIATEAHYAADSIVFESDELAGIYSEHGEREGEDDHLYWADAEAFWSIVEAGACLVNISSLPKWFADDGHSKNKEFVEPWRMAILKKLKERLPENCGTLKNFEKAIDNSTWVKTGHCKCLCQNGSSFRESVIELERISDEENRLDGGSLFLYTPNKVESLAHFDLKNVSAVISCSLPRCPRLAVYVSSSTPLKLQFESEDEFDEWKSELSSTCCRTRNISGVPSANSIWITTSNGEIFVCDLSQSAEKQRVGESDSYSLEQTFTGSDMPIKIPLYSGFLPGSSIVILGCIQDTAKRFSIDFLCCEESGVMNIAYQFNPRFDEGTIIQNSMENLMWGIEERSKTMPFQAGELFEIKVECTNTGFAVSVSGMKFTEFLARKKSDGSGSCSLRITHLSCTGDIIVSKIMYTSNEPILQPNLMFWRQIDGHLRKVESAGGVTWGIGFDSTPWIFLRNESFVTHRIHDTRYYYVYENQRWNPLTGYTSHGLPTDRFMWSDITGKYKRTRENTTLLSKKWHWANDWSIDFQTPGGVDKEGWQYAVDFPSSYHGIKTLMDYVRRRRWFRCAKLEATGPWIELGYTPLSDCSLFVEGNEITGWAVAANGDVLFRRGVSMACPAGLSWEHVACDEQIISISCGPKQVWAIGKSGTALCRLGITSNNPIGNVWEAVEAPTGASLKQITIGEHGIWALDASGRVSTRCEVCEIFPLGSHWKTMPLLSQGQSLNDDLGMTSYTKTIVNTCKTFRQISARNKLWGVTTSGQLAYRLGTNSEMPMGLLWMFGIEANLLCTSA